MYIMPFINDCFSEILMSKFLCINIPVFWKDLGDLLDLNHISSSSLKVAITSVRIQLLTGPNDFVVFIYLFCFKKNVSLIPVGGKRPFAGCYSTFQLQPESKVA